MLSFSDQIPLYYYELEKTLSPNGKLLGDWMKANYIGSQNVKPKTSPAFWSAFNLQHRGFIAHQNFAEAHHKRINGLIDEHRPGFYRLVGRLMKEMKKIERDIEIHQMKPGWIPKSLKVTVDKNEAIDKFMSTRMSLDKLDYLRLISCHLRA